MIRRLLAAIIALALLGGCGKRGAPSPPGPPDQVIYPKVYPSQ